MRVCYRCKQELHESEFYANKHGRGGLDAYCKPCKKEYLANYQRKNAAKLAVYYKEYANMHKASLNLYHREHRSRNLPKYLKAEKAYRDSNPEKKAISSRKYQTNHPEKGAAQKAKRRAAKIKATPAWANQQAILGIYALCQKITTATGIPHHVDHVVPLIHPDVCGLHVEHNLQILTAEANHQKNNFFIPGFQDWK